MPGQPGGVAAFDKQNAFSNRQAVVDRAVATAVEEGGWGFVGGYAVDLLTDTTSLREAHTSR
jgi:hypothetical protein